MPQTSFDPFSLAAGGIGGVFDYFGAKKQADAQKYAADKQSQATQQALDFAKQRYGQLQTNLAPYVNSGVTANGRLNDVLTRAAMQNGYSFAPTNAPSPASRPPLPPALPPAPAPPPENVLT